MHRLIPFILILSACGGPAPPTWMDARCQRLTDQRDAAFGVGTALTGLGGASGITAALPDDTSNTSENTARNIRLGFGVGSVVCASVGASLMALSKIKSDEIAELCEYVDATDGGVE